MLKTTHSTFRRLVGWLQKKLSARQFFIVASVIVGLSSGGAAIVLKYTVHWIESFVETTSISTGSFMIAAAFPLIGLLLTVAFIYFFVNGKFKKGSAEIAYAIAKKSSIIPTSQMYSHMATAALTVGFGGSTGLESPMVSTGSAIGSNYGRVYNMSYKDRTILLACGAAAGISAAFNAPIAGVLFAIEVLLADISAAAFIPLIISSACGALLSKVILADGIILSFELQQPFDHRNVPFYVVLGLVTGLMSAYYAKTFSWLEHRIKSIGNIWIRAATGGVILFTMMIIFPPLFGEGYHTVTSLAELKANTLGSASLISDLITSETSLMMFLAALMLLKVVAAAITIGSGGNGGSFGPSLFTGAYTGFVFARLVNLSGIAVIPETNFTLVSMAGLLSGVLYAPLTGIFLIAEITGGYGLMIPLMIVSAISIIVAHFIEPQSMEGKKLASLLKFSVDDRDKYLLSKLDLSNLIETNFLSVKPDEPLRELVNVISRSQRNLFPVLDNSNTLVGIISLDDVRNVIFHTELYDSMKVNDLMKKPSAILSMSDNLHDILKKFDETREWNLPLVENGTYKGFVSKSSILSQYRSEILKTV
jgi:chloride channel protein, CIC family